MSTPSLLDDDEVRQRLEKLPGWALVEGALSRSFVFGDFVGAFGFMSQAALVAERQNHHPDWSNVYKRVDVRLSTHEAGGITERDFDLARAMSRLAEGP